jgi:hypothetical protein
LAAGFAGGVGVVDADVDAVAAGGVDQTAAGGGVAVDVADVAIGWVGVLWMLVTLLTCCVDWTYREEVELVKERVGATVVILETVLGSAELGQQADNGQESRKNVHCPECRRCSSRCEMRCESKKVASLSKTQSRRYIQIFPKEGEGDECTSGQ